MATDEAYYIHKYTCKRAAHLGSILASMTRTRAPKKKAASDGVGGAAGGPKVDLVNVNGPWIIKRQQWIDNIVGQFGDEILSQPPLTIAAGGHIAPFEVASLAKIAAEGKVDSYTAGVNIMAIKHFECVNPHVPIYESKVRDLKNTVLQGSATVCPFVIDIAVTWRLKQDPPWGQLHRVSPEAFH